MFTLQNTRNHLPVQKKGTSPPSRATHFDRDDSYFLLQCCLVPALSAAIFRPGNRPQPSRPRRRQFISNNVPTTHNNWSLDASNSNHSITIYSSVLRTTLCDSYGSTQDFLSQLRSCTTWTENYSNLTITISDQGEVVCSTTFKLWNCPVS